MIVKILSFRRIVVVVFLLCINCFVYLQANELEKNVTPKQQNQKGSPLFVPIIPYPNSVDIIANEQKTFLTQDLIIFYNNIFDERVIDNFIQRLEAIFHCHISRLSMKYFDSNFSNNSIVLNALEDIKNTEEEYAIEFSPLTVNIRATNRSLYYALESLSQIIYYYYDECLNGFVSPLYRIYDYPLYAYRGMHLDVARHFFPVEEVKKYIDLMSHYKYNYFHWHLTDDQGWRIQIDKYPCLVEVGSIRNETVVGKNLKPYVGDNIPYYGYYTKEEIKDVVRYAALRNIEIIPEIDMPGHTMSAIASYPFLSCSKATMPVFTNWGSTPYPFCVGNDSTYHFVKGVIDEIVELFPSEYIHIGGDECRRYAWSSCDVCQKTKEKNNLKSNEELQNFFTKEVAEYVHSKNKKVIGWDEILEGKLNDSLNIFVMVWRKPKYIVEAIKQGKKVIASPQNICYFNFYQSWSMNEPLSIGGYTSLKEVYDFSPIPNGISNADKSSIIGAQNNLWTEYIKSFNVATYMAYPRAIAMSETLWTLPEKKNYSNFCQRLETHLVQLDNDNILTATNSIGLRSNLSTKKSNYYYALSHPRQEAVVKYVLTDTALSLSHSYHYEEPLLVKDSLLVFSKLFHSNSLLESELKEKVVIHKGLESQSQFLTYPEKRYSHGWSKNLHNGILQASYTDHADSWTGYFRVDSKIAFAFKKNKKFSKVSINYLYYPRNNIRTPTFIEVKKVTKKGKRSIAFKTIYKSSFIPEDSTQQKPYVRQLHFSFPETEAKHIHVIIGNRSNEEKKDYKNSWLFLDEIILD